jgi:type II secretory pathway component PulF
VIADGRFAYRALTASGDVEEGDVAALSVDVARDALSRRGLLPLSVTVVEASSADRSELPVADLALGLRMLADLLEAGLPMGRALVAFAEVAPRRWAPMIPHLQQSLREGRSLAAALEQAPVAIPALVIGIARAGEAGSGIAGAIRRAAGLMESSAAARAAARAALTYPAILAFAGTASIGIMVGVVLPRFATILADLGQVLPPSTRFVLGAAAFARSAFVPAIALVALGAVALRMWASTTDGRRSIHALLLRVPLLGNVRRSAATARATGSLAALLASGVPLRTAIAFAARSTGDAELEARLAVARERVVAGTSLGTACTELDALTPLAGRLMQAGEESGRLVGMLEHAAALEQAQADRTTQVVVRFLEPALILTFAGVVGIVAAALLQAVYSVRPAG